MSFAEALARQQSSVFERLGEDAQWQGIDLPVRIIRREADEDWRLDQGSLIETGRKVRVRRSEVPNPCEGETFQVLDQLGAPIPGAVYRLAGEPRCDRKGVWHVPVSPA